MKFQDQLEFHEIPEWLEYYINYSELKRILKLGIIDIQKRTNKLNEESPKPFTKKVYPSGNSENIMNEVLLKHSYNKAELLEESGSVGMKSVMNRKSGGDKLKRPVINLRKISTIKEDEVEENERIGKKLSKEEKDELEERENIKETKEEELAHGGNAEEKGKDIDEVRNTGENEDKESIKIKEDQEDKEEKQETEEKDEKEEDDTDVMKNIEKNYQSEPSNTHTKSNLRNLESNTLVDWIKCYKNEIFRVSNFYVSKKKELNKDFVSLTHKMNFKKEEYKSNTKWEKNLRRASSINTVLKENKEFDEVGFAVSWKRACSNVFTQVSWLHGFQNINIITAERLLLKFRDIFKNDETKQLEKLFLKLNNSESLRVEMIYQDLLSYTKKLFKLPGLTGGEDKVLEDPEKEDVNREIVNLEADTEILDKEVLHLRKTINDFYADHFTDGNKLQAKSELESRMSGYRIYDLKLIALHLGMIMSSLLIYFMISLIPSQSKLQETTIFNFFPIFHTYFVLIFALFGAAVNITIFRRFRINYIFILEIDPKSRLTQSEIIRTSLFFTSVWVYLLILMYCSINFNFFDGRFYYLPIAIIIVLSVIIVMPFHFFYSTFRKALFIVLFKNFFPIGKHGVRFRDFLFGDILTSLTRPFQNIALSICLITCDVCRDENIRSTCSRNITAALVVTLIPFCMRFFQCLNKFYYTRDAWPHLANALKYTGGITNTVTSWMYGNKLIDQWLFLTVAGVTTTYLLFWDFRMDWNLCSFKSKNFFLRDKLVYPKYYYYCAMVINFVLRLTWLIALLNFNMNKELEFFIYAILEVYRRIQWALFRIENENISNYEKYRNILAIPDLPLD